MSHRRSLALGTSRALDGGSPAPFALPPHHLVTHGVVVGMTGSGKTGLLTVLVEEALRSTVPVLMIDVKGDLPNLLLALPDLSPAALAPWLHEAPSDGRSHDDVCAALASQRERELGKSGIGAAELTALRACTALRVITPGSSAGEPLHLLSSLERRSARWDTDPESARASLSAAVSLVLRLLGRDPDPAKSKDHVLLSVLAERRLTAGEHAELGALLDEVVEPPIADIGALPVDAFMPKAERRALAAALNTLLAAPSFASWRSGCELDVGAWLTPASERTPGVIVSVAHLDDEERALVLGVLLEEVLSWVRSRRGSRTLEALVVFDEVYGFLPPHPHAPPTKRPLVALMKQARAFGVGVVLATQNPMDLDYRALSNAGLWCVGRLQTDADRERVVEGLSHAAGEGPSAKELSHTLKRLAPRWFLLRDAHADGLRLLRPRYAMSLLRGPMTGAELRAARAGLAGEEMG
jgi:Bacterial protein of unknown function (DUF853)